MATAGSIIRSARRTARRTGRSSWSVLRSRGYSSGGSRGGGGSRGPSQAEINQQKANTAISQYESLAKKYEAQGRGDLAAKLRSYSGIVKSKGFSAGQSFIDTSQAEERAKKEVLQEKKQREVAAAEAKLRATPITQRTGGLGDTQVKTTTETQTLKAGSPFGQQPTLKPTRVLRKEAIESQFQKAGKGLVAEQFAKQRADPLGVLGGALERDVARRRGIWTGNLATGVIDITSPSISVSKKLSKLQSDDKRFKAAKKAVGFTATISKGAKNILGVIEKTPAKTFTRASTGELVSVAGYAGLASTGTAGLVTVLAAPTVPKVALKVSELTAPEGEKQLIKSKGFQVLREESLAAETKNSGFLGTTVSSIPLFRSGAVAVEKATGGFISSSGKAKGKARTKEVLTKFGFSEEFIEKQGVGAVERQRIVGDVGTGVAVLGTNVASEVIGRKFVASSQLFKSKTIVPTKVAPRFAFKTSAVQIGRAGTVEGASIALAEQAGKGRKINIQQAGEFAAFGGVSAGIIGGSIVATSINKPRFSKALLRGAYVSDPFEKPGDVLADIAIKGSSKLRKIPTRVPTITSISTPRGGATAFTTELDTPIRRPKVKTPKTKTPKSFSRGGTSTSTRQPKTGLPSVSKSGSVTLTPVKEPSVVNVPSNVKIPTNTNIALRGGSTTPTTTDTPTDIIADIDTPIDTPTDIPTDIPVNVPVDTPTTTTTQTPTAINIVVPTPKLPFFPLPPLPGGAGGSGPGRKARGFRRKLKYTPSLVASIKGITGKKSSQLGGAFGIRPITKEYKAPKKTKVSKKKGKLPEIKLNLGKKKKKKKKVLNISKSLKIKL